MIEASSRFDPHIMAIIGKYVGATNELPECNSWITRGTEILNTCMGFYSGWCHSDRMNRFWMNVGSVASAKLASYTFVFSNAACILQHIEIHAF